MIAYYDYEGNIDIYLNVLNAIIGKERESFIDMGCCTAPNTPLLRFKERWYVDIIDRKLDHPEEQKYFMTKDILDFDSVTFVHKLSVAFCLDCLEHLTVSDGYKLLSIMEKISYKQILFTPLTDLFGMVKEDDKNPEAHRSLWKPEMIPGYACLLFPNYHKTWNGGAFFFWKSENIEQDFIRVKQKLADYAIYERGI